LLAEKLNTNERTIRRCIKELRDNGYIIVSHSLNSGYRLGSEKDRDGMIREYESRIASMSATVKALKQGKDLGQMEVEL
jgi:DeoR/GlpR family transcriptional regulator of sugar metabolism